MLDNRLKIKKLEQEIDYSLKLLESSNFEDEKQKIQYYINGLEYAKEIFKEKGDRKNEQTKNVRIAKTGRSRQGYKGFKGRNLSIGTK